MTEPQAVPDVSPPLRLDFGCGKNKREGFIGIDAIAFPGVDAVCDLSQSPWLFDKNPFGSLASTRQDDVEDNYEFGDFVLESDSVAEAHASHFVEHLTGAQRVVFFNELYRVMKVGAQATIICPNWSHERAYGDPTHQWPPISTWTFFYLNKQWRDGNAPHCGYTCDFDHVITGSHDPNDQWVAFRNQETKMNLMYRSVNTTTDVYATLTKRAP